MYKTRRALLEKRRSIFVSSLKTQKVKRYLFYKEPGENVDSNRKTHGNSKKGTVSSLVGAYA